MGPTTLRQVFLSCLCPSGHLPATYHPPRGCFRLWVFSIFSFLNIQDTVSEESFLLLKIQRAPSSCFLELKKKKVFIWLYHILAVAYGIFIT